MCPTEDAQIHRLLVFFSTFPQSQSDVFFPRANFRRRTSTIFCWFVCPNTEVWGEISKSVWTPQIQQGCQLKRSVFPMIFRISSGVSFYILRTYMIAMLHGRFLLGINVDVSKNSGTPKIIHFNRVFHYKSSISGYPYFWRKHPYPMSCCRFLTGLKRWCGSSRARHSTWRPAALPCQRSGAGRRTPPKVLSSITQVVDGWYHSKYP